MLLKQKVLEDPLKENVLPQFAQKLNINHYSSTQFSIPDSSWLFKYVVLTQEQRRALFESNSAMECGKRVGDALQRIYAETIWKLSPLTKKIAPSKNEKISYDNALQEQVELFKEYEPVDDKDAEIAPRGSEVTFPINDIIRASDKLYKVVPAEEVND
mgnify:CR=1 FL=1